MPDLVWSGSLYGVSWHDSRDGNGSEIYFARFDLDGNKVENDIRITNALGGSTNSSLTWTGDGYGISWRDFRNSNYGIYFEILRCCEPSIDSDSDTYDECKDCDDNDDSVHPGASEICGDFKDNDSLIKSIKFHQLEDILEHLNGGMKKKAYAVLEAFKKDVKKVIICSGLTETPILDALEKNAGTVITYE